MLPTIEGVGRRLPPAATLVTVSRHDARTNTDVQLGSARDVLAQGTLDVAERDAVRNVVASIDYIQHRFAYHGFDAPDAHVRVVLDAIDGPAANGATIFVPQGNVMANVPGVRARPNTELPRDAAQHELAHVLQGYITGVPISGLAVDPRTPGHGDITRQSVAEGIADASAALALRTWRTGGDFLEPGGKFDAVRNYDDPDSPTAMQHPRARYASVHRRASDPHIEGGVIVGTVRAIAGRVGWSAAEDVLWGVLNDPGFARRQEWFGFATAMDGYADATHDPAVRDAIRSAMAITGLDGAIDANAR